MEGSASQPEQLLQACSSLLQIAELKASYLLAQDFTYYYEGSPDRLVTSMQQYDGGEQLQDVEGVISCGGAAAAAAASSAGTSVTQSSLSFSRLESLPTSSTDQEASSSDPISKQAGSTQAATPSLSSPHAKVGALEPPTTALDVPAMALQQTGTQASGAVLGQGDGLQCMRRRATVGAQPHDSHSRPSHQRLLQNLARVKQRAVKSVADTASLNDFHRVLAQTQDAAVTSTTPRLQHLIGGPSTTGANCTAASSSPPSLQQLLPMLSARAATAAALITPGKLLPQPSPRLASTPLGVATLHRLHKASSPGALCTPMGRDESADAMQGSAGCIAEDVLMGSSKQPTRLKSQAAGCSSHTRTQGAVQNTNQDKQQQQQQSCSNGPGSSSSVPTASAPQTKQEVDTRSTSVCDGPPAALLHAGTSAADMLAAPVACPRHNVPKLQLGLPAGLHGDAERADDQQAETPVVCRSMKPPNSSMPKLSLGKLAASNAAGQLDPPRHKLGDILLGVSKHADQGRS